MRQSKANDANRLVIAAHILKSNGRFGYGSIALQVFIGSKSKSISIQPELTANKFKTGKRSNKEDIKT